jgi:hypothetical protein
MSDQNGIQQSPFKDAWPTPDVGGTGVSGIGYLSDQGAGPNGIVNSPFDKAFVPTPGGSPTADGLESGKTASCIDSLGGADTGEVTVEPWDITSSRNTIDRR